MNQQQQDKAAFFAQYWGQYIKTSDIHSAKGLKPIEIFAHSIQYVDAGSYLLLKPLSAITDEDAIEIARILLPSVFVRHHSGWKVTRDYAVTGWPYIKVHNSRVVYSVQIDCKLTNFDIDGMEERLTGQFDMRPAGITDFLRSRGYLIPFRNYSTDQILEIGWAKLREP